MLLISILDVAVIASRSRLKNGDAVSKEYIKPRPPANFLPFGPKGVLRLFAGQDRRDYYDALQAYDEQEDLTPLVQFLEAQTVKTWSRSVEGKKAAPPKKLNSFLL